MLWRRYSLFQRGSSDRRPWAADPASLLTPPPGNPDLFPKPLPWQNVIWMMGPPRSGTAFHAHTEAWTALAHGRKRWLFYAPTVAVDNEGAPPRRRRAPPSFFAPRRSCCARWAGRLTPAQREVAARLVLRLLAWVWGLCRRSAGPLTGAAGAAGCYWCYLGAPSPVGGRQALPAP